MSDFKEEGNLAVTGHGSSEFRSVDSGHVWDVSTERNYGM